MSINKRNFAHLASRINLLEPRQTTRRELMMLVNAALSDLEMMSLPADQNTVTVEAANNDDLIRYTMEAENTLSQWRHTLRGTYISLLDRIAEIPYQPRVEDHPEIVRIARSLQSSLLLLRDLAAEDLDSLHFQPFRESEVGRKKLAQAVRSAHEQVGNKLKDARPIISAEMVLAYRENLEKYMDEQFPVTHNDELRPKLTHREALILAREFYDAMESHSPLTLTAEKILGFMREGAIRQRFELPAIEGIATTPYWEQKIVEGFDKASMIESHDHLIFNGPKLQDELPVDSVIRTLSHAGRSMPMIPVNPIIHYMEDTDDPESLEALGGIGHVAENRIVVFRDNEGRPAIATEHTAELADYIRVVRPLHAGVVVPAPLPNIESYEDAVNVRLTALQNASAMTPPAENTLQTEDALNYLRNKWQKLVTTIKLDKVGEFEEDLMALREKLRETAKNIIIPEFSNDANRKNAQELGRLLMLTGEYEHRKATLEFRLPNGVGTHISGQEPDTEVVFHQGDDDLTGHVEVKQGGKQVEFETNIDKHNINQVARTLALHYGPRVGIKNDGFPHGLVVHHITELGDRAIKTGHWLSSDDRTRLTQIGPVELVHQKVNGRPLYDPGSYREQGETMRLMGSAAAMLHGETLSDAELATAGDMGLSGCIMLEVDLDDMFGSKRFDIPEVLYRQCTLEDIKRHLIQNIALSDLDDKAKATLINRVSDGNWDQSGRRMGQAYEELEIQQERVAQGM